MNKKGGDSGAIFNRKQEDRLNGLAGIDYLLKLNDEHSRVFMATQPSRQRYRIQHPTEIAVAKCMDGRVHLPVATNTPLGIIQPWRNLGGQFKLGWPHFNDVVLDWHDYAVSMNRSCLVLVTYHFSRGATERGCAGFGLKTDEAIAYTIDLKHQFEERFEDRTQTYIVQCGFETDLDALVLHSEDSSKAIDLSELKDPSAGDLAAMLHEYYPRMPEEILQDFLPLLVGNIAHIKEVRRSERTVTEVIHREWVLAFGRGFDWLHLPNTAIIVGPYDINLTKPVAAAARIIRENLDEGRINGNQEIVLMTSSPYRNPSGPERKFREAKSRELTRFALEVIGADPVARELLPRLKVLTTTVDTSTRKLDILERLDRAT